MEGKWEKGPDYELFRTVEEKLGRLNIIAEDLGFLTPEVYVMLDKCGYPGMKVLTFGFDGDEANPHFPANYGQNAVAYTGTHDNDTTLGWAMKADPKVLAFAGKTIGFSAPSEAPEAMIRYLFKCPCNTVIVPMQDVLNLGSEARMNYPGTIGGNWGWRMKPGMLTQELSLKYYKLNKEANRR